MLRTILIAIVLACTTVPAHAGRLADVDIYDRKTGQMLPLYSNDGRLYVPGEPGHEYEIRIRNKHGRRILAVTSVDGVNVITGETADPDQGGYVLGRYGRTHIAGWRKSMDRIATFYFTALPDSYAARTDRPNNVGVIGVALFKEEKPWRWPWSRSDSSAEEDRARSQAPSAEAESLGDSATEGSAQMKSAPLAKRESRLGTGHGRKQHDRVVNTTFERDSDTPDEVIAIYYDSRHNLIAQGVIPVYSHNHDPNPFPAAGFVPDP